MKHIVFNSLPPVKHSIPSPAFSILKSFMQLHNYEVKIEYWIFEVDKIIKEYIPNIKVDEDSSSIYKLFPSLCYIAIEQKDFLLQKKLKAFLQKSIPTKKTISFEEFDNIIHDISNKLIEIYENRLQRIISDNVLLFGFTSKYDSWVASIVLANIAKKIYPDLKTIIGGFTDKKSALSLMKISNDFDFAVWGEGEYSLLDICNQTNSTNDFSNIPRLIYKENNELIISKVTKGEYFNLNEEVYPNYSDYFNQADLSKEITIPFESGRSCHWLKCKFCFLNKGYKYRKKTPERQLKEIIFFTNKYQGFGIEFLDNDVVGKDINIFEEFLNKIIEYNKNNERNIKIFTPEISSKGMSKMLIKKLALAGVMTAQIGVESLSDNMLKKIQKESRFADYILFFKFSKKYNILLIGMNIIQNILNESDEDILENINNLHFLRFYLDDKYFISPIPLYISSQSKYYKSIVENKRTDWWKHNNIYNFLPKTFWKEVNRFDLMIFAAPITNSLWYTFESVNKHYSKTNYRYRILRNGKVFFEEYIEDTLANEIEFFQDEYWEVLKVTNDKVSNLEEIFKFLIDKGYKITQNEVIEIIENLKTEYILYSNNDYSNIISIIDTDVLI